MTVQTRTLPITISPNDKTLDLSHIYGYSTFYMTKTIQQLYLKYRPSSAKRRQLVRTFRMREDDFTYMNSKEIAAEFDKVFAGCAKKVPGGLSLHRDFRNQ